MSLWKDRQMGDSFDIDKPIVTTKLVLWIMTKRKIYVRII